MRKSLDNLRVLGYIIIKLIFLEKINSIELVRETGGLKKRDEDSYYSVFKPGCLMG